MATLLTGPTVWFLVLGTSLTWLQSQTRRPGVQPPAQREAVRKETLTNAKVIELVQLGLSESLIIEKIRQSECSFDTSVEGLRQLKAAKVSDRIIHQMLSPTSVNVVPSASGETRPPANSQAVAGSSSPSAGPPAITDIDGKAVPFPPDKGAYLWDGKRLTLLIQSEVPSMGMNVAGEMKAVINPFGKRKLELQLIGVKAKASFDHTQPVVLLSGLGDVIPGTPSYRLLFVQPGGMRKDRRILGTYELGGLGISMRMVDNEVACEIRKIKDGLYALVPQRALPDGEYGIVQVTRVGDAQANSKSIAAPPVWDFGIYAEGPPKR